MMLRQESYELYPAGNAILRVNNSKVRIRGERPNTVSDGCSIKFHKIIQNTVVMEYFLRKVADLQPETF